MKIPAEFNGSVSAFWHTKHGFVAWFAIGNDGLYWADLSDDYVRISNQQPISCTFFDVRKEQIDALEKQIKKEQAESLYRINVMRGQIQELQALEAQ